MENSLDGVNANELLDALQGGDNISVGAQQIDNKPPTNVPPIINKGDETGANEEVDTPEPLSQEEYEAVSNDLRETLNTFTEDADEDTKAIKKDMLSLFENATDFDEEGNLIDKDGNQVASYEDLVNKIGQQEDAIFDTAGNQVDANGKILVTKHELEIQQSENNKLGKELGYEFEDENGNLKLYKKGKEGLKDLAMDIAIYQAAEEREQFFNSMPVLREVAKHLLAGGELDDFQKPVDYSQYDISKMSAEAKRNLVKNSYLAEGLSENRVNNILANIDEKKLDTEAQEALDVLEAKQTALEKERSLKVEQAAIKKAEDNKQYWKGIEVAITKGDLDGFSIPDKDKQDFFRYLAIPVKDGLSQDQIDRQTRSTEGELKEAYYRYKGYDVSDIVRENTYQTQAMSVKQRIQKRKELSQNSKPNSKGKIGEISLNTILP